MNHRSKRFLTAVFSGLLLFSRNLSSAPAPAAEAAPVTITENDATYTLSNGIVTAMVAKASGDLVSLKYKGLEMLATFLTPDGLPDLARDVPGANPHGLNAFGPAPFTDHQYGFWSHDAMGPPDSEPKAVAKITIDPAKNGGERAEVSVKGVSNGRRMGTGPGSNMDGNFAADIEIRYTMGRGDSGVYTYCVFEHQPSYPASSMTEARFCVKLADIFDWMSVGPKYNRLYPHSSPGEAEEDKYDFTTVQFENPAYGWSSTTKDVGFYLLNPSVEYLSGGPTKVEFLGHRDTNRVEAPCILNYWRSSHYGGAVVDVAEGEHWTKVIGPFMLYVDSGSTPQAMYADAVAQQAKEAAKWPYAWVEGVDYPRQPERATVSGQFMLNDPLMPGARLGKFMVGLTHPAYTVQRAASNNTPNQVDWQTDAKHYEFWVRGGEQGRFSIPQVRPGTYTLHAFADGVLGEFAKADVTVSPGQNLDLGKINWTPVRRGRQVWEIGIPNRTGSEFFKGDDYAHDGMSALYASLFPNDINYVIGKSNYTKDWYFQQPPHAEAPMPAETAVVNAALRKLLIAADPQAKAALDANPQFALLTGGVLNSIVSGGGPGRATPFTITFDMPVAPKGTATLRLGICASPAQRIDIAVNGQPAGAVTRLAGDSTIARNGIQGIWIEKEFPFDASLLKAGTNTLTLTVPAGSQTSGIIYDYLRLELDETAIPAIATTP